MELCCVVSNSGRCIYIDTEANFSVERIKQILQNSKSIENCDVQKCLKSILIARVTCVEELVKYVTDVLPAYVREENISGGDVQPIRLVVVDSIAFLLRGMENMLQRSRLVHLMAQKLTKLAQEEDLAVVVTNHSLADGSPALGMSWSSVCPVRLSLLWSADHYRICKLYQSPSLPLVQETIQPFRITKSGIEEIDDDSIDRSQPKRQRTE
jgi:meiotic recombination protein DMC1